MGPLGGRGLQPALALVVALLASAVAPAAAAPSNPCAPGLATAPFTVNTNRPGLVDLFEFSVPAPVTFYECIGTQARRLGTRSPAPGSADTSLHGATTWSCDRQTRQFASIATLPGGTVVRGASSARTMSCANRFTLEVPRRVAPGQVAAVRIVDRWGIGGIRTTFCLRAPRAERTCESIAFAKAVGEITHRFRPRTRGRWRVELRVRTHRVRDAVAVGGPDVAAPAALPTVLATGDSTMRGLESFLADTLAGEATVLSEVRPGLALSGPNIWVGIAAEQARRVRPDATVLSIGANEGYSTVTADGTKHECCDSEWVLEYALRMRTTMYSYARGGRGRVFVLTIPAPRDPRRATINRAVNNAIVLAAGGIPTVKVLRMDTLFTPNGYREVMRHDGQDVHVREPDGIHLNVSGAAIEARVVAQALRAAPQ